MTDQPNPALMQYVQPLLQYRRLVLGVWAGVLVLGLVLGLAAPVSYSSTASILVFPSTPDPTKALETGESKIDMATELRIATSQAVVDLAAARLSEDGVSIGARSLANQVTASSTKESTILDLTVVADDADLARAAADAIAESYLAFRADLAITNKQAAEDAVTARIATLQARLSEVESELIRATTSQKVVLESEKTTIETDIAAQQLALGDLSTPTIDATVIIDPARQPTSPDGLGLLQILIGAFVAGMAAGVGAAFVVAAFQAGRPGDGQSTDRRPTDGDDGHPDGTAADRPSANFEPDTGEPADRGERGDRHVDPETATGEPVRPEPTIPDPAPATAAAPTRPVADAPVIASPASRPTVATPLAPAGGSGGSGGPDRGTADRPAPGAGRRSIRPIQTDRASEPVVGDPAITMVTVPPSDGRRLDRPTPASTPPATPPEGQLDRRAPAPGVPSPAEEADAGTDTSTESDEPATIAPDTEADTDQSTAQDDPPDPEPAVAADAAPADEPIGPDQPEDQPTDQQQPEDQPTDQQEPEGQQQPTDLEQSQPAASSPTAPALVVSDDMEPVIAYLQQLGTRGSVVTLTVGEQTGESATAVGFAVADALHTLGARVLLIDAAVAGPTVDTVLGVDRSPGLIDVLSGSRTLEEAVRPLALLDGLHALTVGTVTRQSVAVVRPANFERLLNLARMHYHSVILVGGAVDNDLVIPAVAPLTDGLIVGTHRAKGEIADPGLFDRLSAIDAPTLELLSSAVVGHTPSESVTAAQTP